MKAHQSEHWLLAEAKNRFSEVTRCALSEGPQTIFRRDGNVVVISEKEYLKLTGKQHDFKYFLLCETPDLTTLNLTRDDSPTRDIEL